MEVLDARDAETAVPVELAPQPTAPDGCMARLPIAPLVPGATRTLTLRFHTVVPHRFGTFGVFDDQLTVNGGWYPYLAALDATGRGGRTRRHRSPTLKPT